MILMSRVSVEKNMGLLDRKHLKSFPKIELHRHLEGSLRADTLHEIIHEFGIQLPDGKNLARLVQVQPGDPQNMENFLSKFQALRQFYQSPEIIQRLAYEAVADAALDGIQYLEIMFTPAALSSYRHFPLDEVMDWIINSTKLAAQNFGIEVRLIASINRHESLELAAQVAGLAAKRIKNGIVAINLAGNEAEYSAGPFKNIFEQAHQNGLAITVHAGEWSGARNVQEAIDELQANRIGHGVRIFEDPRVVDLARQTQTLFEVCITSNLQSGVIANIADHPLQKMLDAGLNISLNTDDPGVEGITLSDEFYLAYSKLGVPLTSLADFTLSAARASFLSDSEKEALIKKLNGMLNQFEN